MVTPDVVTVRVYVVVLRVETLGGTVIGWDSDTVDGPAPNNLLFALPGEGELNLSDANGAPGDWGGSEAERSQYIQLLSSTTI